MARAGTASRTSALTDAITSWFSGVALGGGIGAIIHRHPAILRAPWASS